MSLARVLPRLAARLAYARRQHPEGASLPALRAEVAEVEAEPPGSAREADELLDVAVVALRLWLGERQR